MKGSVENDAKLVREFKKHSKKMKFIGFKYSKLLWGDKTQTNKTRKAINAIQESDLTQQIESVKTLWKELLEDAIVFLKHQDQREGEWHDAFAFGVENLSSFFQTLGSFERSMSPILTRSRDHLVHVMRVYLFGCWTLKHKDLGFENIDCGDGKFGDALKRIKKPPKNESSGEENDEFIAYDFKVSKEEKEAMWCIIALCHDLGLVLENVFTINKEARHMFEQFGRVSMRELEYGMSPLFPNICNFVLRLISSDIIMREREIHSAPAASVNGRDESGNDPDGSKHRNTHETEFLIHVQPKYYQKFMVALDDYDHGVLSCVILLKNLIYFLESDSQLDHTKALIPEDARQFLIRKNILRAIAAHNCESIYHIGFMSFPFLLLLFDEMQEWERPRPYMFQKASVPKASLEFDMVPGKASFEIAFSEVDTNIYHYEIYSYARRKFDKFKKVLRCAVDVTPGIDLKFTVTDKTENKVWPYVLHHKDPSPPGIDEQMPSDEGWRKWFKSIKQ